MYVDVSPGQESQLFHVLIYQPQLLLSWTVVAADPIPQRLLLYYSYIIFFFMFLHDPTVATDAVCSFQYSHFPELCKHFIVEQVTTECDERIRRLVFISFTSMRPHPARDPKASFTLTLFRIWSVYLNHWRGMHDVLKRFQFLKVNLTCFLPVHSFREFEDCLFLFWLVTMAAYLLRVTEMEPERIFFFHQAMLNCIKLT